MQRRRVGALLVLHALTVEALRTPPSSFSRRSLLASSGLVLGAGGVSAATVAAPPKVTDRIFLDIRVIQSFDVEVLEDASVRGRLTFGLFGDDAPLGTKKFLSFVDGNPGTFASSGGGPSYVSGAFNRLITPGVGLKPIMIEGGRINGLQTTEFAGQLEYEYMSRLVMLRPVLEGNDLKHDRRGLLTRDIFNPGPEFGVTLAAAPQLDGKHEVIGMLEPSEENEKLLALLEGLPYITGVSREGEGTAANAVFQAQKQFFTAFSKAAGDKRAEDRTGVLLRRVELTRCGRLEN